MLRRIGTTLLLSMLLAPAMPSQVAAQASLLSPTGSDPGNLSYSDDAYVQVSITDVFPSGVKIGGATYTDMYIGSNGYVTFGHGNSSYSPLGIAAYTSGPIVAAQYDDLRPGAGGTVTYAQAAGDGRDYVVATWAAVQPYNTPVGAGTTTGGNTFQIVLRKTERAATDFDLEIRYVDLNWAQARIIAPAWPTAGWSAGDQITYSVIPNSGTSSFLSVESGSNVGEPGVYRWQVIDGTILSTPTVTATASATSITATSAVSGGTVASTGGSTVTAMGLAYGTSANPTTADGTAAADQAPGAGSFTATLSGLAPGTTYHVRAYATNALGTSYGPQQSFTTSTTMPQTITFAALDPVTYGDAPSTLGATATSGLDVAYASSDTSVAAVSNDTLYIRGAGTAQITATQSGDASWEPATPVVRTLEVSAREVTGTFTVAAEKIYDATTVAPVLTRALVGVLPADSGLVELLGGPAHFASPAVGDDKTVRLDTASLGGSRASHYTLAGVTPVTADIVPGPAAAFTIEGPESAVAGEQAGPFVVTFRDAFGNATTVDERTVLGLTTSQGSSGVSFEPGWAVVVAAGEGQGAFHYTSEAVGVGRHTLTVEVTSGPGAVLGLEREHDVRMSAGAPSSFRIEATHGGAIGRQFVDSTFAVRITALDAWGNVATGFEGTVDVGSASALSLGQGSAGPFEDGVLLGHEVRVTDVGTTTLVATLGDAHGASEAFDVLAREALVSVTIGVSDETPLIGETIDIEVTVFNEGAETAQAVSVRSPLAEQNRLVVVSVDPERGTLDAPDGRWQVGDLAPGERVTLRIRARVVTP